MPHNGLKVIFSVSDDLRKEVTVESNYSEEEAKFLGFLMFCMENKLMSDQIIETIAKNKNNDQFLETALAVLEGFDKKLSDSEYVPAISATDILK